MSASALATLQHEDKIRARANLLHGWTEELAAAVRALGARTFPTQTYFFLADFAAHDARQLAERLRARGVLIKPLDDPLLGPGYMRVTTALPKDNARFLTALEEILRQGRREGSVRLRRRRQRRSV